MNELAESGVKYNADDVVMITKNFDGELLWLEKGNLKTKPVRVGSNSKGKYAEYIINGKEYTVAYGTNGYIVSFYPSGN